LADFCDGLDDLGARLAAFTPEAVAAHCDIDAATTRRIARELAAAPRAAVYARIGTHANRHGTLAAWTTELINVLTGNLDREGGVMFPLAPHDRAHDGQPGGRGFTTGRWRSRVAGHPEVMGELPVVALAEEIETPGDGQVRALVTVAGNPVLSTPDGTRLDRALAALDFMVSVDIYLNETTRHADVILPPPSPLERAHYDILFLRFAVRSVANYSPALFDRDGPSEQDILLRLAMIAAGRGADGDVARAAEDYLAEQVARETANPASPIAGAAVADILARVDGDDACDRMLDFLVRTGPFGDGFADDVDGLNLARLRAAPHGIDFGPMRPQLPGRLRTPDGRLALGSAAIDGELAAAAGELTTTPDPAALLLVGRREFHSNNSWMHNLPSLIERPERCTLRMHADDAARLGLADGTRVTLRSAAGAIEVPLEVHAEMRPGVVSLPHGYGHRFHDMRLGRARAHAGASANDVVVAALDPLSGNAVLNGVPVTVAAA
ncbi:MAG: molybdopterin dinucleotide binding domain-containing protein, partial [Gammaproteobacteria bacterium]